MFNIPLLLTYIRLIFSLFIYPFILYFFWSPSHYFGNVLLGIGFALLSVTDFLDGYWARKYRQETKIGGILDPIADKILLCSTLLTLQALGKIYFYWVILFISREFFVMGLRLIALEYGITVSVSSLAKWKTTFQMIFLFYLLIIPVRWDEGYGGFKIFSVLLLTITLSLGWITLFDYYKTFKRAYVKKQRDSQ